MGDEEEELLGIWGITKSWSLDIDLCNGPSQALYQNMILTMFSPFSLFPSNTKGDILQLFSFGECFGYFIN